MALNPSKFTVAVRAVTALFGGLMGLLVADWLVKQQILIEPINRIYLGLLGLLLGYLLSARLTRTSQRLRAWFAQLSPDMVVAGGTGATAALLITVLLNSALERVPGYSWQLSAMLTIILVSAAVWFAISNRHYFLSPAAFASPLQPSSNALEKQTVIDTSALIDGRVLGVVETNFLPGQVLLPDVVMYELQHIADASDANRRRRGRRGLEIVSKLEKHLQSRLELVHDTFQEEAVDTKLIKLCHERNAQLLTTDYNLAQVASVGGIRVLNLNELANALKPGFSNGETLNVQISKTGREMGQGVAYLDDGTMIVVEGGASHLGELVDVVVTSHLQTNVGRMIFAQLEG